ncbi:MAG: hypothetical protein QOE35_1833 [Actinomycetota bacterium]
MSRAERRTTDPLGFGVVGDDEPVFVVRGCDLAAPATIEAWARLALLHGAHPVVADHAGRWADRVREWQRVHGANAPSAGAGA